MASDKLDVNLRVPHGFFTHDCQRYRKCPFKANTDISTGNGLELAGTKNGNSRKRGTHWKDGKRRVCALCRNAVWEELDDRTERCIDTHFWLTPSTIRMIQDAKARLHTTYEGALRSVMRDYEIYTTMLENERIANTTGLKRMDSIGQQDGDDYEQR